MKLFLNKVRGLFEDKSAGTADSLEICLRCSTNRRPFNVLLQRSAANRTYTVVRVTGGSAATRDSSTSTPSGNAADVDVSRLDLTDVRCPFCAGGKWTFIKCNCGGLSCSGGAREYQEKYRHVCPWCGNEGYIEGTVSTISGRSARGDGPSDRHVADR